MISSCRARIRSEVNDDPAAHCSSQDNRFDGVVTNLLEAVIGVRPGLGLGVSVHERDDPLDGHAAAVSRRRVAASNRLDAHNAGPANDRYGDLCTGGQDFNGDREVCIVSELDIGRQVSKCGLATHWVAGEPDGMRPVIDVFESREEHGIVKSRCELTCC